MGTLIDGEADNMCVAGLQHRECPQSLHFNGCRATLLSYEKLTMDVLRLLSVFFFLAFPRESDGYSISCFNSSCISRIGEDWFLEVQTPLTFYTEKLKLSIWTWSCGKNAADIPVHELQVISRKHRFDKGEKRLVKMNLTCNGLYQVEVSQ